MLDPVSLYQSNITNTPALAQLAQLLAGDPRRQQQQDPAAQAPALAPMQVPQNNNGGVGGGTQALNMLGQYLLGNPSNFVGPPTNNTWQPGRSVGSNIYNSMVSPALSSFSSLFGGGQ